MGVPMRVISVDGWSACCEAEGTEKIVHLLFVLEDDVQPGDYVSVHRDHAMKVLSPHEAQVAWSVLREALDMESDATRSS